MIKTVSKIDNIKALYQQVNKKTEFIKVCAAYFGKSALSLRNHWFGNFWSIPEIYVDEVIKLLQNTIKNQ